MDLSLRTAPALGGLGWTRASDLGLRLLTLEPRAEGPAKPPGSAPGLNFNQSRWCLTAALLGGAIAGHQLHPNLLPTAGQIPKLEPGSL